MDRCKFCIDEPLSSRKIATASYLGASGTADFSSSDNHGVLLLSKLNFSFICFLKILFMINFVVWYDKLLCGFCGILVPFFARKSACSFPSRPQYAGIHCNLITLFSAVRTLMYFRISATLVLNVMQLLKNH